MAIIRISFVTAVLTFCVLFAYTQSISYPALSSQQLKSTATDAAMLLGKAMPGNSFTTSVYSVVPQVGFVFIYDSTIKGSQACKVKSDGSSYVQFSAAEDNGLCFGLYQYLHQLGFRFYQPGTIWEIIPQLNNSYLTQDSIYSFSFKYNGWFVSGGYARWAMDMNNDNGPQLSLYQTRNGMTGQARFRGHRADLMSGTYLAALANNPCYVANSNGSRLAGNRSVPDIFNNSAKNLWSNTIEQQFTQYKNTIYANKNLYVNQYRNFSYTFGEIGIEVPDGANWGNSKENDNCNPVDYPKPSNQHFTLANYTANKLQAVYPDKRLQLYAYSTHADVPDATITISPKIDVQLIPTVYQMESSTNGLRNRWYNRSSNVSEYHYLNLSGWSGEMPSFTWKDIKNTVQIAHDKKSQGLVFEASPAKFGSLPVLLAVSNSLVHNMSIDSTLHEFCNSMFAEAAGTVFELLQLWGTTQTQPSRYNIQLYLQLVNKAVTQTQNAPAIVKDRLRELKAYLHLMILQFDLAKDDRVKVLQETKDAAYCMYVARTNKLMIVNSFFIISGVARKYPNTSNFYQQYNYTNGTAYQNGNLAVITATEIDADFAADYAGFGNKISNLNLQQTAAVVNKFTGSMALSPIDTINIKLAYTYGLDYYFKTDFNIQASKSGSFTVNYTPRFDMPGKGFINFLLESTDESLQVIKDVNIDINLPEGTVKFNVPKAGNYKLTVVTKYKTAVDMSIITNGNYFYKEGAFLGNRIEDYPGPYLPSLPKYFYIPKSLGRLYFVVNNSFNGVNYASLNRLQNEFGIRDNNENAVQWHYGSATDSSLFYIDVTNETSDAFWHVTKAWLYKLTFVNISNVVFYAKVRPLPCKAADFTVSVVSENGQCLTKLVAVGNSNANIWQINDIGVTSTITGSKEIKLPFTSTPNALVTLITNAGCQLTKKLSDDVAYMSYRLNCGNEDSEPPIYIKPVVFPNPSTGIFNFIQNGAILKADEVVIFNANGVAAARFTQTNQFNISSLPAGLYWYTITSSGKINKGRLIKL